ncbi:cytochrome c551 peroxidase [Campylobacter lari]|nr:cytochrome c551 peroxidase [Campylobacter lari]
MYQKMGVFVPYDNGTNWKGRYEITQDPHDQFVVKVPSLRNIAKTAPYFHDVLCQHLMLACNLWLIINLVNF